MNHAGLPVVFPGKWPGHGLAQGKWGVGRAVCPHERTPRACLPGLPVWGTAKRGEMWGSYMGRIWKGGCRQEKLPWRTGRWWHLCVQPGLDL